MATATVARRPEERPCIWTLAGVLSYRPCDREYRCDTCELYQALSRHRPAAGQAVTGAGGHQGESRGDDPVSEEVAGYLGEFLHGCRLYLDRWYSPRHFWVAFDTGTEVTLGLHGHIPPALHPIDDIRVPEPGAHLRSGDPSGWIARAAIAVPMRMPISGTVTTVNGPYLEHLRQVSEIPAAEDWLMRLEADRPLEMEPGWLRGEGILVWYRGVVETFERYLREALDEGTAEGVGRTLPDGGAPGSLETVLGRERFFLLVDELLL